MVASKNQNLTCLIFWCFSRELRRKSWHFLWNLLPFKYWEQCKSHFSKNWPTLCGCTMFTSLEAMFGHPVMRFWQSRHIIVSGFKQNWLYLAWPQPQYSLVWAVMAVIIEWGESEFLHWFGLGFVLFLLLRINLTFSGDFLPPVTVAFKNMGCDSDHSSKEDLSLVKHNMLHKHTAF
jgi:hypothetical protein